MPLPSGAGLGGRTHRESPHGSSAVVRQVHSPAVTLVIGWGPVGAGTTLDWPAGSTGKTREPLSGSRERARNLPPGEREPRWAQRKAGGAPNGGAIKLQARQGNSRGKPTPRCYARQRRERRTCATMSGPKTGGLGPLPTKEATTRAATPAQACAHTKRGEAPLPRSRHPVPYPT